MPKRSDISGTSQTSFQIGTATIVASGPGTLTIPAGSFDVSNLSGVSSIVMLNTIADLQAVTTPDATKLYYIKGYYAANDGGGHRWFYWNSSLATTVDADDDGTAERSDDYGLTTLAPNGLATISTPGRFVGIITTDFINVLWAGVRNDNSGDQAPRINLVLKQAVRANGVFYNAQNTGENNALIKVYAPAGSYSIQSTIKFTTQSPRGANMLHFYGTGRTFLNWRGTDPNIPMFRLTKYSFSHITDMQVEANKALDRMFLMVNDGSGNGPTSTRMHFKNLRIKDRFVPGNEFIFDGKAINYVFDFSTSGAGQDTNNDIGELWDVEVVGANWFFKSGGFNPHQFLFYRCTISNCNWGISSPSFYWVNGISSTVKYAVFYIAGNHQPISIHTHNDEHSGRFLEYQSVGDSAPIKVDELRWDSSNTLQGIVINVSGRGTVEISHSSFKEGAIGGRAKNRFCRIAQDIAYNVIENTGAMRVTGCLNSRDITTLSGTSSPLLDTFCIGEFLISQSQFDFINNEINLGYAHNLNLGQVLTCMNGGANSFGFPMSSSPYYIVPHASDPNRFKLLTNYENETPFTFVDNGGSKVMKLRLGGSELAETPVNGRPVYFVRHQSSQRPYLPVMPKDVSILLNTKRYNTAFALTNTATSITQGNIYNLLNIYSSQKTNNLLVTVDDGNITTTHLVSVNPVEMTPNQWYRCTPIASSGTAANHAVISDLVVRIGTSYIWQDYGVNTDNYLTIVQLGAVSNRASTPLLTITAQPLGGRTSYVNALFYGETVSNTILATSVSILNLPHQSNTPWFKGAPNISSGDATKINIPVVMNGQQYYLIASTSPTTFLP